jgi:hypothetical protein
MAINNDPGTAGYFSVKIDDDILESGTSGAVLSHMLLIEHGI